MSTSQSHQQKQQCMYCCVKRQACKAACLCAQLNSRSVTCSRQRKQTPLGPTPCSSGPLTAAQNRPSVVQSHAAHSSFRSVHTAGHAQQDCEAGHAHGHAHTPCCTLEPLSVCVINPASRNTISALSLPPSGRLVLGFKIHTSRKSQWQPRSLHRVGPAQLFTLGRWAEDTCNWCLPEANGLPPDAAHAQPD